MVRNINLRLCGATGIAAVLLFLALPSAQAQQFIVTNTDDSGPGSLRQAIIDSNTNPPATGTNFIEFSIPVVSPSPQTILLFSPLPPITSAVVIDGSSQLGLPFSPHVQLD